jgi:HEAT repeat protein
VEVLRLLLRDPDPAVAAAAARLAGWLRVAALLPELLQLLAAPAKRGEGDASKTAAVRALGRIGDPAAEKPLLAILAQRSLLPRPELAALKTEAGRALRFLARRRELAGAGSGAAGDADG